MINKHQQQFLLDVLSGRKAKVTQDEKDNFIKWYKELLNDGYYIGKKAGELIISNKFPANNIKQELDFNTLIAYLFTRV
jgi:hypothetical protein